MAIDVINFTNLRSRMPKHKSEILFFLHEILKKYLEFPSFFGLPLSGGELIESPPTWENKIDLPGLKEIECQVARKEEEKEILIKDINKLRDKEDQMIRFRRLLWTKGKPLENIVREAFLFLGFSEIRKMREENLEDWAFEFRFSKEYHYGVLEIKGADKRTSLANMTCMHKRGLYIC